MTTEEAKEQPPPEPGVGDVLGEFTDNPPTRRGGVVVVCALGKEFEVSPGEQRIKGQYERWLKRNAMRELSAIREDGDMDLAEFNELQDNTLAAIAGGKYNWGGVICRSSLRGVAGLLQLFYLLLKRCAPDDPTVTEELAERIWYDNPAHARFALRAALGNLLVPAKAPGTGSNGNGKSPTKQVREPETLDGPA